jgi:hemolysin activation/secretion protein
MPQRSKLVWPPLAAAGLLAVSVLPTAALAQAPFGAAPGQTTGLLPPKLPPAPAAPTITPPPAIAGPGASGQPGGAVLLPSLKGLLFVSGSRALNPDGVGEAAAGPTGVAAPQLPILNDPKFVALMKAHLGKPLRLSDLEQIRAQTRAWYVARRHPFVDVVAPPQNINSGVVQMVVSEYQLGKVEVVGAHYFKNSLILQPVDLKPGQKIDLPQLQDNLARLNENPFLSVDAEFRPGEEPGATDLVLRAKDRLPLRVYAGYDNQGVPTLDTREWNAGVNWGNAFGTGQILSYQYTRAINGRFASHSASDVIRVDNTDKILVFGNYAILRSASFLGPFQFDSNGHSTQASFRWVHTLPKLFGDSLTGHVQLGYDFKSTDNNAFFDQFQLGPPSVMETNQFPVVYDGAEADKFGSTAIENDLVFAPGRLTARDNDADFQTLVAGAKARYVYDRLSVTRTERLPEGVSLIARVIVQRSSAILPNSEQLGGGGVGSVRGYSPDTGLGSNGELASVELRAPPFSPGRLVGLRRLDDLAQVGVFYDYASLRQPYYPKDIISGSASNGALPFDLASSGVLLRYSISRNISVNLDAGWQLKRAPASSKLGNYAAFAVIFSN